MPNLQICEGCRASTHHHEVRPPGGVCFKHSSQKRKRNNTFLCTPSLKSKCGSGNAFLFEYLPNFSNNFPTFIQLFVFWGRPNLFLPQRQLKQLPCIRPRTTTQKKNHDHLWRHLRTNLDSSCGRGHQPAATRHEKNLGAPTAVKEKAFDVGRPNRSQPNPHLLFREGDSNSAPPTSAIILRWPS
jgi:hypothetical protein